MFICQIFNNTQLNNFKKIFYRLFLPGFFLFGFLWPLPPFGFLAVKFVAFAPLVFRFPFPGFVVFFSSDLLLTNSWVKYILNYNYTFYNLVKADWPTEAKKNICLLQQSATAFEVTKQLFRELHLKLNSSCNRLCLSCKDISPKTAKTNFFKII